MLLQQIFQIFSSIFGMNHHPTLGITVNQPQKSIGTQTETDSNSKEIDFQEGLKDLYLECFKFTDFYLVSSSGDKIPCHRIILAARCKFFREMFQNVSENSTNEPLKV